MAATGGRGERRKRRGKLLQLEEGKPSGNRAREGDSGDGYPGEPTEIRRYPGKGSQSIPKLVLKKQWGGVRELI